MSTNAATATVRPRRLRGWRLAALIVVVALIAGAAYASFRPKMKVQVVHARFEDIESTVSTQGMVAPVRDFPARANFTGQIERIYVALGQRVRPGQMLLQMKDQYADPRLENAQASLREAEVNQQNVLRNGSQEDRIGFGPDLARAQAEHDQAEVSLRQVQELLKRGSVSEAEVESAAQRLRLADANLAALQKRMTQRYSPEDVASWKTRIAADRASVKAERVSWANANISTPIAGEVYLLGVHPYDFVPAGTDLVHVADLSKLQVLAEFEEPDLTKLHEGEPVRITWDGAPGKTWHGHIAIKPLAVTRMGPRRVGQCTIALEDVKGDLPVNTNVAVLAVTERHAHVLAVPREALHTEGGGSYVYRLDGGKVKKTPVVPGIANAMNIEVLQGIRPEDTIVLHAADDSPLTDGLRVTTRK
ncbi:HlyD family efflux transporter periplasmic adaptor subunit [Acidobacteria bacterium AB60]|nr:HlyD family efflux transporter periplasmic adaptor subunit [Acidobacteria bacterium AB60]